MQHDGTRQSAREYLIGSKIRALSIVSIHSLVSHLKQELDKCILWIGQGDKRDDFDAYFLLIGDEELQSAKHLMTPIEPEQSCEQYGISDHVMRDIVYSIIANSHDKLYGNLSCDRKGMYDYKE